MSCFLIPKHICKNIEKKQRGFWWGQKEHEKKINWIRWEILRKNKNDGGLGFGDLHSYNKALLAKQAWRILNNPNDLWVKFLKDLYFPNNSFIGPKCNNNSSWLWKSIIKCRDLLKKGLRWEVGNEQKIKFWEDKWIPIIEGMKIRTDKPINCQIKSKWCNKLPRINLEWRIAKRIYNKRWKKWNKKISIS